MSTLKEVKEEHEIVHAAVTSEDGVILAVACGTSCDGDKEAFRRGLWLGWRIVRRDFHKRGRLIGSSRRIIEPSFITHGDKVIVYVAVAEAQEWNVS